MFFGPDGVGAWRWLFSLVAAALSARRGFLGRDSSWLGARLQGLGSASSGWCWHVELRFGGPFVHVVFPGAGGVFWSGLDGVWIPQPSGLKEPYLPCWG